MCDYSSFAKLDIWSAGTEVVDFLQYLCSNDVDVPVGKNNQEWIPQFESQNGDTWNQWNELICIKNFLFLGTILNTGMHNKEGGYENDCSITRLAYNRFMLMSPSIQQMRSFTWVKHHLPDDGSVYLQVRMLLLFASIDIN